MPRKSKVKPKAGVDTVNARLREARIEPAEVVKTQEQVVQVINRMRMANALMRANMQGPLSSRREAAARGGYSYGTDRDLYAALGFPISVMFDDYLAKYQRTGYGKRIVNAFPDACWRVTPEVTDDEDPAQNSKFEDKWRELVDENHIWHYMRRTDRIAGIGQFGVLFIGADDGKEFKEPLMSAKQLLYLTPLTEKDVTITQSVGDKKDPRYGLPELYSLSFSQTYSDGVHWSRVIHVADDTTTSEVYGTPRLEAVYNNLLNLARITGGSGEMFWRGAFPGLGFVLDADADADAKTLEQLETEIENYIHGMNRYMKLQGLTVQELGKPAAVNPKFHVDAQLQEVSAATGIPKRILVGSEEARLAGEQDTEAWLTLVDERRRNFCEPMMLRPLIDRLIECGILPKPRQDKYKVVWPDIMALSEQEQVDIAVKKTEMMKMYQEAGLESLMPPDIFMEMMLFMDVEEVKEMLDGMVERLKEEERDAREAMDTDEGEEEEEDGVEEEMEEENE